MPHIKSGFPHIHFSTRYEIYEQRDRKWGVLTDGNFNGMMGDLQREESDFCMIAAPTPERLQVIDYTKGYTPDVMIVLSLKPTLLPENLALIRPFSGELQEMSLMK